MIKEAGDRQLFKVPLDQGGFDQHQSKLTIISVINATNVSKKGRYPMNTGPCLMP